MRDLNFLNHAITLAEKSPSRIRVAAIITDGARIISRGVNDMNKSHPLYAPANIHAELACVLAAPYTDGCTIYIARINKKGEPVLAQPCKRCNALITQSGIRKVVFTTDSYANVR